ncbi:MAG: hypothetical protein IJ955_02475 [Oscillospiraceae bacterium]|nr:hypothetical protein [Oscillospiraceae bacterium]
MAKKEMEISNETVLDRAVDAPVSAEMIPVEHSAKEEGNASGIYCYIGPSIRGLIQHGAIFRGSRTRAMEAAKAAIEQQPLVKTLIVSGDSLPSARLKIKTPGNALYQNYQCIAGR